MNDFYTLWNQAAITSTGLFWMALWAFVIGYLISSIIQVFVTQKRMKRHMGETNARSISLSAFFGFLSSSCSFAALSTTRALFAKGAGLVPALAFMLASTNLVVELGIIIALFLSWQFVVGEYLGGLLLILFTWLLVSLTLPRKLEDNARTHARDMTDADDEGEATDWKSLIVSSEGWRRVAHRYVMEWDMVWKDVSIGFTVAGIIAVFVPRSFFHGLFPGAGLPDPSFWQVVAQALVGPLAAFFTFIGSMGNIPLAAVLFGNGVSFAGVMAFIFSDLVVLPVLRVQARYYGWKMALYILGVMLAALIAAAMILHATFDFLGLLPDADLARQITERTFFEVDLTFGLNIVSLLLTAWFLLWKRTTSSHSMHHHGHASLGERALTWLAMSAYAWLAGGLLLAPLLAG